MPYPAPLALGRSGGGGHQHCPDSFNMNSRLFGPFHVGLPEYGVRLRFRHCIQQILPLFKHSQGNPEGLLDSLRLTDEQSVRREGMSRMAAIPLEAFVLYLPENSSAVGTVIRHLRPECAHLRHITEHSF